MTTHTSEHPQHTATHTIEDTPKKPGITKRIWNTLILKKWREKRKEKKDADIHKKIADLEHKLAELQKINTDLYQKLQKEGQNQRSLAETLNQEIKHSGKDKLYIKSLEHRIQTIESQNKKFQKMINTIDKDKLHTLKQTAPGVPAQADDHGPATHGAHPGTSHDHHVNQDHAGEDKNVGPGDHITDHETHGEHADTGHTPSTAHH